MARFELEESSEFECLEKAMKEYAGNVEETVNGVLWEKAGKLINDEIMKLLPVSGRTWSGGKNPHTKGAKFSKPFYQANPNLAVIINSKSKFDYLYFPDDGSSTLRHAGLQDFMFRGVKNQESRIIDLIIDSLVSNFEGE